MKLIFSVLFILSFNSFGQQSYKGDYNDGYWCIRKAEKHYEKGNYSMSLKYLNKADQMDYGFCGNAWMEARQSINTLRCKNYIELRKYNLARTYLDSIYGFNIRSENDSLRWKSYQLELGIDSLSSIIDKSLENIIYIDSGYYDVVFVPLPNEFNLAKFVVNSKTITKGELTNKQIETRKKYWILEFKKTSLYAMLKG